MKKLVCVLMTLCLLCSCFVGVASAEDKRVLKFLCIYDQGKAQLYEMLDKWQAEHPDVDLQVTAITAVADMTKQLTTMAVAGDLPDLIANDRMYMGEFVEMGIFEDITDLCNADLDMPSFYEGPLSACVFNDRIYGLPFVANNLAVYYNKTILEANGIEIPTADWTWEDYKNIAKACASTEDGVYGAVMSGTADGDGSFQFMPWLWGANGSLFDPENGGLKEALTYLRSLIDEGAMTPEICNWTQTDASNQFLAGKAALFTGGTWHLTSFSNNISDFEWGVINYPVNPNTGKYATCLGGHGLSICKGGNVEDAWDLMKFLSSDEVMGYWMEAQNYIPVRSNVVEASDYFMNPENLIYAFTSSMFNAASRGGTTNYLQIDTVLQSLIAEVYSGTSSVDDALAQYVPQLLELVK